MSSISIVLYSLRLKPYHTIIMTMKDKRFSLYTWGVLAWNLIVILWGAYVRATGSGAGCGRHWPLCDGQVLPRDPGVAMSIEFTHRLLSGIDILLVAVLLLWGYRLTATGDPLRKSLNATGIFFTLEALLGAGLVLFELTAENSSLARAFAVALHLANTFFLVASLALSAYWASGGKPIQIKNQGYKPWLLGAGLIGMILIGMSGAVTALGDTLFPAGSLREGIAQEFDPNAHFLVKLRVFHPIIAVLVAGYSLTIARLIYQQSHWLGRRLLVSLVFAGVIQLSAGLLNLVLLAPIPMQIIHLFTADITWILFILTTAAVLKKE